MRLTLKAEVLVRYRIDFLLKNSDEFVSKLDEYREKVKEFGEGNFFLVEKYPHLTEEEFYRVHNPKTFQLIENLLLDFFIADDVTDRAEALGFLFRILEGFEYWAGGKFRSIKEKGKAKYFALNKVECKYVDKCVEIKIKAPLDKGEFIALWEAVKKKQENFFTLTDSGERGFYISNAGHFAKYKKLSASEQKLYKKFFIEKDLESEYWGEILGIINKLGTRDIFKPPVGLQNFDEDLRAYRLSQKYRPLKVAEDKYAKIKLAEYLYRRDNKGYVFGDSEDFSVLVKKYLTLTEMEPYNGDARKLIGATNFHERRRAFRQQFYL